MQLWNDFVDWFTSQDAEPVVFVTVVLFVGIVVSGLIAAWIARGTVRGLLQRTDRQQKAAAIAALVDAATEASVWNSLTPAEQVMSDRAVGQADIQVRLLPVRGAALAATWASHQLAELKRASATFGYQLDPAVAEFRDRLIEWQNKPGRAKRIFAADLERWSFAPDAPEAAGDAEQQSWAARQQNDTRAPAQQTARAAAAELPTAAMPAPVPQPDTGDLPKAPDFLHAREEQNQQHAQRYSA
ncbi:hypothetical protein [Gryllotalpicola ginsengisoli]|uniref:hypothetical protein n=1 Tax=Gryllotalpicola ginsengisoli TaxID=444608 RepID=UPI0003B4391C|nr:hypothetical protein [Gryllotalpicola ginsengisoli]